MEERILRALHYQISIPNTYKFLVRYLNAAHATKEMVHMASYAAESSLLSYSLITSHLPSQLAAAAVLIARNAIGRNNWSPTLVKYTNYREEDIKQIARDLLAAMTIAKERENVYLAKKYSRVRYGNVAAILPSEL